MVLSVLGNLRSGVDVIVGKAVSTDEQENEKQGDGDARSVQVGREREENLQICLNGRSFRTPLFSSIFFSFTPEKIFKFKKIVCLSSCIACHFVLS